MPYFFFYLDFINMFYGGIYTISSLYFLDILFKIVIIKINKFTYVHDNFLLNNNIKYLNKECIQIKF